LGESPQLSGPICSYRWIFLGPLPPPPVLSLSLSLFLSLAECHLFDFPSTSFFPLPSFSMRKMLDEEHRYPSVYPSLFHNPARRVQLKAAKGVPPARELNESELPSWSARMHIRASSWTCLLRLCGETYRHIRFIGSRYFPHSKHFSILHARLN